MEYRQRKLFSCITRRKLHYFDWLITCCIACRSLSSNTWMDDSRDQSQLSLPSLRGR